MPLVTHQLQGSFCPPLSKSLCWGKRIQPRKNKVSVQVGLANAWSLNKCSLHLSVGTPQNFVLRRKSARISSFKGNARNEESEIRTCCSKPGDYSVKLSYLPQTNEESPVQLLKAQNVPHSYASVAQDSVVQLPIVQKLFRKWLTILVSQSPNESAEGIFRGQTETVIPEKVRLEIQNVEQEKGRGDLKGTLKVAWGYFLSLDANATIKLLLIFFIPFYLAVNVVCGTKVARQLTPLWVIGPLVVALYIKLAQWIIALYIFTFKMTIIFLKNTPTYLQTGGSFMVQGGIQAAIYANFFKPLVDIKNTDYKQLVKQKQKKFQEWSQEKFLDIAEAIWPFYCRTIRFLKRANLI